MQQSCPPTTSLSDHHAVLQQVISWRSATSSGLSTLTEVSESQAHNLRAQAAVGLFLTHTPPPPLLCNPPSGTDTLLHFTHVVGLSGPDTSTLDTSEHLAANVGNKAAALRLYSRRACSRHSNRGV